MPDKSPEDRLLDVAAEWQGELVWTERGLRVALGGYPKKYYHAVRHDPTLVEGEDYGALSGDELAAWREQYGGARGGGVWLARHTAIQRLLSHHIEDWTTPEVEAETDVEPEEDKEEAPEVSSVRWHGSASSSLWLVASLDGGHMHGFPAGARWMTWDGDPTEARNILRNAASKARPNKIIATDPESRAMIFPRDPRQTREAWLMKGHRISLETSAAAQPVSQPQPLKQRPELDEIADAAEEIREAAQNARKRLATEEARLSAALDAVRAEMGRLGALESAAGHYCDARR